ncbi:MAG: YCF48-related protein [Halioglobus sp.]|nr:YCF48-related protein [Halioglobus sp.]
MHSQSKGYNAAGLSVRALACWLVAMLGITACEAPLNLAQVEQEKARDMRRYDMFQATAHRADEVVVVSSVGAVLASSDGGASWTRTELPDRPSLIDVTACPNGAFHALDSQHRVWSRPAPSGDWSARRLDTTEDTLSIHCAPSSRLWVSASFGTLYWSDDQAGNWNEFSLYEDLQFTAVRFVDDRHGFAVGEFGTVMVSDDGGDNWESLEPIPNDFYPMAADFRSVTEGWVGGLDGVIWHTADGGQTWQRQETVTKAPIYGIHANGNRVFAVGGSAKLVELDGGAWQEFAGAPPVLAYMRGLDILADGSLLVAGGGGTLAVIDLNSSGS